MQNLQLRCRPDQSQVFQPQICWLSNFHNFQKGRRLHSFAWYFERICLVRKNSKLVVKCNCKCFTLKLTWVTMAIENLYFFEYTLKQFDTCSLLLAEDQRSSITTSESRFISAQNWAYVGKSATNSTSICGKSWSH